MTRLERLADAMGLHPGPSGLLIAVNVREDRWDLMGCVEGPAPLPDTKKHHSFREAMERAERWLADELKQAQAERREA